MINMSLSEIAQIAGCTTPEKDIIIQGISIDTRKIHAQNLFVAIRGEQFDGNDFINEAEKKGAAAALVSKKNPCSLPQLVTADTLIALGKIAEHWRDRFSLPLIGVTGSNGKTTTKNMIAAILRAACNNDATRVLATEGNLNNAIGLPLMLARLNAHHAYAVIEMGMNHFNEIAYLTKLAKPDVALITNAAESHLEGLKTIAGVATAKGEIFQGLSENGTAILNRDDAHFSDWLKMIEGHAYLTFGLKQSADVTASRIHGSDITVQTPKGPVNIQLPLLGKHNVMNALAAIAATLAIDIELSAIKTGLENITPAIHRMQPYSLPSGALLIDDTYNANPFSLKAAVNTLTEFPGTRIVVLADMKELGDDAKQIHFNCGQYIHAKGIDHLFTIGDLAAEAARGFGDLAQHFAKNAREKLLSALQPYLQKNVTILVKGSRSMQMEQVVYALTPHIEHEHTH